MLWVWIVVLLLLLSKVGVAKLIIRPLNAVTTEDTAVTMHCRTSVNDSCHWLAAPALGHVMLTIHKGNESKTGYSVNKSQPGQCDLIILKPKLTSQLLYACADDGFGERSYASLAVLKSNLLCAHNIKAGTAVFSGQAVRYSIQLVYSAEMNFSVYLERPNGSVDMVCSGGKQDGMTWRLECDYTISVNGAHRFFAAVSQVRHEERIALDRSVPTERFYCSSDDWLRLSDELKQSTADEDTTVIAISTDATDTATSCDDSKTSQGLCDILVSLCLPLVIVFAIVIVIVLCALFLYCCRRWTLRKHRGEIQLKDSEDNHDIYEKQRLAV